MTTMRRRWRENLLDIGAAILFLAYAINFLYFFVDDEAIAFVYAQNILRGRGLTYSAFEGPTEGYSNFLHVWIATLLLGGVRLAGLPKIAVFAAGKILSLTAGTALVVLIARVVRRRFEDWRAQASAVAILALAGPLAVWSCSSLETALVALLFTAFVVTLLWDLDRRRWLAVALGVAVIMARVDGFVLVGIAGVAGLCALPGEERRHLLTRVAAPLALIFAVYTGWRWWYFGSLLSLPLRSKVLYKLLPPEDIVSNAPSSTYLARFLEQYHPAGLLLLAFGWLIFWRPGGDRRPLGLIVAAAAVTGYAAIVGDWMFGFRFFVVLFPLLALLAAYSVASLAARAPRLATLALAAVVAWSVSSAREVVPAFEQSGRLEQWRSWWSAPSFDEKRFFGAYYPMYADIKDRIPTGTVTINNQAGLLPFLLDLENIDDLGITSRFFAALPTADVVFTEVGRYHPLSNRPPLRAGEAYLVHRDAPYLISWIHLLRSANGHLPRTLLDGHFHLVHASAHQALYQRAREPQPLNVHDFKENVAHPARLRLAALQGSIVDRGTLRDRLSFLTGSDERLPLADGVLLELHLDEHPLSAVWIDSLASNVDTTVALALRTADGGRVLHDEVRLRAGEPIRYHRELPTLPPGGMFTLRAHSSNRDGHLTIADLRILGQSQELKTHVERELFAQPQPSPDTGG